MVQVGNRQGVVYELVQGKTLSEIIALTPERAAELGGVLAGIARTLHNAEVKKTDLPSPTEPIRDKGRVLTKVCMCVMMSGNNTKDE